MSVLVGLILGLMLVAAGWVGYRWGYEDGRFDERYGVIPTATPTEMLGP